MRLLLLVSLFLVQGVALASNWNEPHPWRREALLEGRYFDYDSEAFLHYFSYRHLNQRPGPGEEGLAGTVGSVTADQAFVDVQFYKELDFDDGRNAFSFKAERGEDFDGAYSRQIVGYSHEPLPGWRLRVRGDVHTNKAESDLWLQSDWTPGSGTLFQFAWIQPDLKFNSKSPSSLEYREEPQTFFGRALVGADQGAWMEVAFNISPAATLADRSTGFEATGDRNRGLVAAGYRAERWRSRLTVRGESTNRRFDFGSAFSAPRDEFDREMHSVTLSVTLEEAPLQPEFGGWHLHLREEGWFGTASGSSGEMVREEALVYGQIRLPGDRRHYWEPAIYISRPRIFQQVDSTEWHDRDERAWRGKLALPWHYIADRESGAVVTISPSLLLHEAGFGGGNVQIHWPL